MAISAASRRRAGRAAIVAASVAGHGLFLAVLGLTTPALKSVWRAEPRAVALEMWVPPVARRNSHRAPLKANAPSPIQPRRVASDAPPPAMPPLPAAPAPAPARPPGQAGPGSGPGDHPAPLPGAARGGDLRSALRGSPVGCANRDTVGLTRREREACDDAWGKRRDQADIAAPIEPDKREAWDAVAARKARIRARKEAPPPQGINPSDNAGGTRTNGIGILGY